MTTLNHYNCFYLIIIIHMLHLNQRTKDAIAYYVELAKKGWSMFNAQGESMNIEDREDPTDDLDGVLFNSETNMGYGENSLEKMGIDYNKFTRWQLAYRATHNNEDYKG